METRMDPGTGLGRLRHERPRPLKRREDKEAGEQETKRDSRESQAREAGPGVDRRLWEQISL